MIDLQSAYQATLGDQTAFADFLCFIIRKRRFAYIDSIGFLNEEYLIASVDFIAPCGGVIRKLRLAYVVCLGFLQCGIPHRSCRFYLLLAGAVGKRQGISIPYPSPTPLLTPLGIRCGGAYRLPRWTGI